ncbi:MAG: hypothetical protein JST80_09880 [Bdellovibrionales bacterium]|nr:hypothetical protein [Bdellovibrionales bacterium]
MRILIFFSLLVSIGAQAQINLDKPVMLGAGDQIYASATDPGWYYFFPQELCRNTEKIDIQQANRLFATFDVGLCNIQIDKVVELLKQKGISDPKVRVFQGLNATTSIMSLRDMYESYDPKIEVLGDPGRFSENVHYRLSLYSGTSRRSIRKASNVMGTLFGEDSIDAYVQVQYKFTSILAGQPRECSSAVAVYVGRGPMPKVKPRPTSSWPSSNPRPLAEPHLQFIDQTGAIEPGVQVIEDKDTHCWDNPTPGVICLK